MANENGTGTAPQAAVRKFARTRKPAAQLPAEYHTHLPKLAKVIGALQAAKAIDEVVDIRDKALVMRLYAKRAQDKSLEQDCVEMGLRAERRAGEMLVEMGARGERHSGHGDQKSESSRSDSDLKVPTLATFGISLNQSSRWQRLAGLSEPVFEERIELARDLISRITAHITEPERRAERAASFVEAGKMEGHYPVIYADPPWRYEHSVSISREIENQYPTMSLEEICALPVADVCLPDCTLFLWATPPKIGEALTVIEAWGFEYRTDAVWDKEIMGPGYYFRQQTEHLLVGVKGAPVLPPPEARVRSVISARRSKVHSEKPEIFYEIIERFYPQYHQAGLLLELFQRKPRAGWQGWGNQA